MAESPTPTRPIRRPSRLGAVWLSYRTRWLLWLLLLGAAFMFGTAAVSMWPTKYHDAGPNHAPILDTSFALPRQPEPAPHANLSVREDGGLTDKEPDWATLRSLTLYSGAEHCRPLWQPGAIPRLESLTLFGWITDQQVATLCDLYDLKSLTLTSAGDLTDATMESLTAEPRLEFLHLGSLLPFPTMVVRGESAEAAQERKAKKDRLIHNAPSLKWPSSLRTLIFDDKVGTPQSRLVEWQQLPRLATLATRLQPTEGTRLPDETLETLRSFPQLRQLFLDENGASESELAVVQQRLLPRFRVRPSRYDPTRGRRTSLILAGGLIVIALLAIQMSPQFVTPASLLTPHFARLHVGFVAGVSMLLVIGSFVALLVASCPISVALGLCGASVFLLAAPTKLLRNSMGIPMPGFTNFGLIMPSVIFPFLGLQLMASIFGVEFDWFLRGQHPWITWGLLAASAWGAFDLVTWHFSLLRSLEEAGCANAPLGIFDLASWTEWCRTIMAAREARGKKPPFALRGRDAELDRFVESLHERRQTTTLALWRLANAQSMMKFAMFFLAIFAAIMTTVGAFAIPLATGVQDFAWSANGLNTLWPLAAQLLGMLLIMPFAFAWQRRSMFAVELLRPMERRNWIRLWFQGLFGEMVPLLLATSIMAVLAWSTGQLDNWSPVQWLVAATLFVGIVLVIIATLMALITVESIWWCLVPFGVIGAIFLMLVLTYPHAEWTPSIQLSTICGLFSTAAAVFGIALWRWQNWEVGQIT